MTSELIPPQGILSDQPADSDQLNFAPYAKTLADISADPMTATLSADNVSQPATTGEPMNRSELLAFVRDKFNDQELRDLCFELGIDYENLGGEGKAGKARELVLLCERRERLPALERAAQELHRAGSAARASDTQMPHGDTYHIQIDHADNLAIGNGARVVSGSRSVARSTPVETDAERASLQRQLTEAQANLKLIQERQAEYVLGVDVPLQLIKEERRLQDRIAALEQQLKQ